MGAAYKDEIGGSIVHDAKKDNYVNNILGYYFGINDDVLAGILEHANANRK